MAPSDSEVAIVAAPRGLNPEAVSKRLRQTLQHPIRDGTISGLRYSPDGKRIIAGDYETGVLQVWDAESGNQLVRLDAGARSVGVIEGLPISPDWAVAYTSRGSRNYSRVERGGKNLFRWELDGEIQAWDLRSGKLLDTFRHDPPRYVIKAVLSPDGRSLLTTEQLSGVTDKTQIPRGATLWNLATKKGRDLPALESFDGVFSPDSRLLAMAQLDNDGAASESINVIDVASASIARSIPIAEKNTAALLMAFTPDGRQLLGTTRTLIDLRDPSTWRFAVRQWDVESGKEAMSHRTESFSNRGNVSPNGMVFAVPGSRGKRSVLDLYDVPGRRLDGTIDLDAKALVCAISFSPDGRWFAVVTRAIPENAKRDATPDEMPQPRIHLIDVAGKAIRETLVAPPAFPDSACFSPDGKTLATGGRGKVLLWDVSGLK